MMDPAAYNVTLSDNYGYLDFYNLTFNEDYNTTISILLITIFSIIFALGIIGNGLVIWIAGFRMKKTISVVWFLHLAIADFLCCASIPLRLAEWNSSAVCSSSFSLGILCFSSTILFYINMSASVLLLTAMSVDRWVSVMWPFWAKVHRTQKLVRITAGIIWVMSLVLSPIVLFLLEIITSFSKYSYNTELSFGLIKLVLIFVIPFLIIFTSYVSIVLKLRRSNRPQRSQRPYRIITAVILGFFICWAPYYIYPIILTHYVNIDKSGTIDNIVNILAYLNSCINPIIYVFSGQHFKHDFLRSIPFRLEEALSEDPKDACKYLET